jgi:hypothetical protein
VGAEHAVYVFQRSLDGQGWQEIAKLTADVKSFSFGTVVAVSGETILVGAPIADTVSGDLQGDPGIAYVFNQEEGTAHAWTEVARLAGATPPSLPRLLRHNRVDRWRYGSRRLSNLGDRQDRRVCLLA